MDKQIGLTLAWLVPIVIVVGLWLSASYASPYPAMIGLSIAGLMLVIGL